MTEVVNKVILRFVGRRALKLVAAANSAARLLGGKTMHSVSKLTRAQSLASKKLKPNSKAPNNWKRNGNQRFSCSRMKLAWLLRPCLLA